MTLEELLVDKGLSEDEITLIVTRNQEKQKESHKQLTEHYENKSFQEVLKMLPLEGTILRPMVGDVVKVSQDWKTNDDGEVIEVRMVKTAVDKEGTGWFLTNDRGVTCLIVLHSFENVIVRDKEMYVTALEVVRTSSTGRALVCKALAI